MYRSLRVFIRYSLNFGIVFGLLWLVSFSLFRFILLVLLFCLSNINLKISCLINLGIFFFGNKFENDSIGLIELFYIVLGCRFFVFFCLVIFSVCLLFCGFRVLFFFWVLCLYFG